MYTFAVLMVFLVAVSAKPPDVNRVPCVSPKAWEANEEFEKDSQKVLILMRVSYDEANERVRVLLHNKRDPIHPQELIILYKKHLIYSIEHSTGKCTVSDYDRSFTPIQIPRNATLGSAGFVGLTKNGVTYRSYYGTYDPTHTMKGSYVISVTEECAVTYTKVSYGGTVFREWFYNIALGIKDPSVFIPPKNCKQGIIPDILNTHSRY